MASPSTVRIDLHCHSWASNNPPLWFMQRLGCPESFTAPEDLRKIVLQRGMDFVTITDHDSIQGVLEIERHPDVLIGCEVTTFFAHDIKVHILCYGFTEAQYREIERCRHDIFELVDYLNRENIVHVCAHPLHKVNGQLTWEHFEQLILLFKRFEILNGSRWRRLNQAVERVLSSLTPDILAELSRRHGIEPIGDRPWEKQFTAGSDDHSGLFVGTCYTEIEVEERSIQGILDGIRAGRTRPCGASDGCLTLAHQVNSIAYQYYRNKIGPESKDVITVLGRIFERTRHQLQGPQSGLRRAVKKVLKVFRKPKGTGIDLIDEIQEVISSNKALKSLFHEGVMSREEFNDNVFSLTSDVLDEMILRVCQKPKFLPWFLAFAPTVTGSYVLCARNLHSEKDLIDRADQWLGVNREPKVGWFTDSITNMDGVSKTCRAFLSAAEARGKNLTMITCTTGNITNLGRITNFEPIKQFPTPGYEKVTLGLPSLLRVFKYVEEEEFDSIVVSTPGPVGLMGLLCGRLMRLPVHGIYHTDLPRIALQVSGDPMFGELTLTMTRLFYNHVDGVFAPSQWYKNDLIKLGIPTERINLMERWVEGKFFSPKRRDESYWPARQPIKLLYVGRISKDKNLDLLMDLYQELAPKNDRFVLHVVGDGPYADAMRRRTASWPRFIMTGAKFGDDLAKAYASSDLFIYPGLLDTFGNVVIEAQSSGLPCVVMNEGGPPELIEPGKTGVVARTDDEFIRLVESLIMDHETRCAMARRAAEYARERFNEETIFNAFWQVVTQSTPVRGGKSEFQFEMNRPTRKVIQMTA